jgi:thymidylate synthase
MAWKTMVVELLWFLRGDTNIQYLVQNDCHIWDGDAYKNYCNLHPAQDKLMNQEDFINTIKTNSNFAETYGELGPIYGKQWRSWTKFEDESIEHNEWYISSESIDQITNLINELKTNPDSRRLMVNSWNCSEIDQMVLPPCHYGFQVYTRELSEKEGIKKQNLIVKFKGNDCKIISCHNANHELLILETPEGERIIYENQLDEPIDYSKFPTRAISLMWNQRSCDFPLGIPMNIASYALLLMMIANEVNMIPDELIGNLGDCHIYLNQVDGVKEQVNREPYPLPTVHVRDGIYCSSVNDIILENYQSHPKIYFPLSN